MLKKILLLSLVTVLFFACNSDTDHSESEEATSTTKVEKDNHFGKTIDNSNAINYKELASKMGDSDSLAVKVKATVNTVCQKKGCWMNIASPNSETEEMFVQFEDYKFFMPKDIAGREVIVDGYAYRDVTTVEELKHFAEDEGKSQEEIDAITEPVEELKFLASGVILLDEESK